MPSVLPPTPEDPPSGVIIAGHHGKRQFGYKAGRYCGKALKPLSPRHLDANLDKDVAPAPSAQLLSRAALRPCGQSWRARLYQHRLEKQFKDKPNGANLGLVWDYRKKMKIPYKKDHFSGAIRPRILMDDHYDKMTEERLRFERRMRRIRQSHLEAKQLNDIDQEVNGEKSIFKPDVTSSNYEDSDSESDLDFPDIKAEEPTLSLDPSQNKESPPNVDSNGAKEQTQPDPESSELSDLSSEISEEE
ncbi:hypothetical protein F5Y06DRAFT_264716 [Hypoxylon sp. FL0890]|nr:hypothetical protein F5Y06DRAFT_264716 [Hypoxylon sp. FL0890]